MVSILKITIQIMLRKQFIKSLVFVGKSGFIIGAMLEGICIIQQKKQYDAFLVTNSIIQSGIFGLIIGATYPTSFPLLYFYSIYNSKYP